MSVLLLVILVQRVENLNVPSLAPLQQRFGTDEDVLVEVLASRTNQEIRELKKAFREGLLFSYRCFNYLPIAHEL